MRMKRVKDPIIGKKYVCLMFNVGCVDIGNECFSSVWDNLAKEMGENKDGITSRFLLTLKDVIRIRGHQDIADKLQTELLMSSGNERCLCSVEGKIEKNESHPRRITIMWKGLNDFSGYEHRIIGNIASKILQNYGDLNLYTSIGETIWKYTQETSDKLEFFEIEDENNTTE